MIFFVLLFTSCHPRCFKDSYHEQYSHLPEVQNQIQNEPLFQKETDYYLVICVDAKHLDYSDIDSLLSTIAKHPNGSRSRDYGHAWIRLVGMKDEKKMMFEGGHSGELGRIRPTYLDGVYALATKKPIPDPNPVQYLFGALPDGFLQKGSGGHKPTFACRIELTENQFTTIWDFCTKGSYDYSRYSLTENQCTHFVVRVAALIGLELDAEVTMKIPKRAKFWSREIILWNDPRYSTISFLSPDALEKSLLFSVKNTTSTPCLKWYRRQSCNVRDCL